MKKKKLIAGTRGNKTAAMPPKAIKPAQTRVVPPKASGRRGNR